ncbi:glucodextranase DOMON-like domain-containing protein [Nocardioides rubriscoriae]|uniref:glucodextranase DOMON-like domain-containing protein n=1 Tax=Nocardioides rubriscoriae TaxID=642762 RepID=UPI001B864C21|nr:glucodextranase DOMON-like domain-containing protein [Nocardioides rubriscoriae]
MGQRRPALGMLSISVSLVTIGAGLLASPSLDRAVAAEGVVAPGAPGALSHFGLARKDCLGTARNSGSKVWYTVAGGVLSDVYNPTIDTTNLETLQYVVTDGRTFTDLQSRDMTYRVRSTDRSGMSCQVVSTARSGAYRLVTDYVTDPRRDAVVVSTRLEPARDRRAKATGDLKVYVRYDATVNGNGGGGSSNGGGDDAVVDPATTALVSSDTDTETNATNRDYAVPLYAAVRADRPFLAASSGYAGTPSDGLAQLDADRTLRTTYDRATDGNVVQTGQVDVGRDGRFTLALGFGQSARSAIDVAGASARAPFEQTARAYEKTWRDYDRGLRPPPSRFPGLSDAQADRVRSAYWLSANVLKASEDKTFPGAVVASLASPWGQAVSAGDTPGGLPVYFGSYREVFARDLYESFTGLLASGDVATARATVRFLFERQQLADGRFPRNSLVNGKQAPDTGGDQLDESAYPILMAYQAGLGGDRALWTDHIKKAADFVVSRGPSFGSERWEEQGGYSPSTIAAEIAGLVAAARIADRNDDPAAARVYRATADHFQRSIKDWTVTTTGPYGSGRYFIRLAKNGDPDEAVSYGLGNGGPSADQRDVVDAGFLELTRLGILPASDPDVRRSLSVVDATLRRDTASGPGFYRYGTATDPVTTAGTEDGYGDCFEPDATACSPSGKPWPTGGSGSGHLWPVLSGERAEHLLQTGDQAGASRLLLGMQRFSSGIGLVPEQSWENPDLAASPYGTDPAIASIGFVDGGAAGSASPLTWAQSQQVRLTRSLGGSRPVEQPAIVRERYQPRPPATADVEVTAPAEGAQVTTATVEVTGRTSPGATVDLASTATDTGGATSVTTVTAGPDGSFSATVPSPFGTSVVTVAVTTADGATGYARRTVVSDYITGTTVLDVTDPTGDDHGPGTFAYPTAADFRPGAFDLERFQVIVSGDSALLRVRTRDLSPTFGSALGAQLLDVFVHTPDATTTSTAAPYASRGYTIADSSAWSRRIEVQGFAGPEFIDAEGRSLGTVSVQASQSSRYITVIVPLAALGTPGPGWSFTVVLHGQDGFSPDQARGFQQLPQGYQFGLCRSADVVSPICGIDPASAPKAVDVLTPAGVDQGIELDPTLGPVRIAGVPVD